MYRSSEDIQTPAVRASAQAHVIGAMRQFADAQCLKTVAEAAAMRPQVLRNKLLLEQPHQLSIHELVDVTRASDDRCLIDGILLELDCCPSVTVQELNEAAQVPLTDRALDIMTHSAALGDIAKDIRASQRVTERVRHSVMNRATRIMQELAIFAHDVEVKFHSVPVLTVAADTVQLMPGLT